MKNLIDIINTDGESNIIQSIIDMGNLKQICIGEWLYFGCFIQQQNHPKLSGSYIVFKNNKEQTHVGICNSLSEAKALCEGNKCYDNYLKFN